MEQKREAVVALGMFDGMHIGHCALIRHAVQAAADEGCIAAVYTFSNHPSEVLGKGVRLLSTADMRRERMLSLGVWDVRMDTFTKQVAAESPEAFTDMLLNLWDVRRIVVGFNYTFGFRGLGTPERLTQLGKVRGFSVDVVQPVLWRGEPVSSTRIRHYIEQGDAEGASEMLGYPYTLCGSVVENRHIGRSIGFPTANIIPESNRVLPKNGVYVTLASLDGLRYRAVTNVGTNPTVGGRKLSVETHLIGGSGDLYGKTLSVAFVRRIRGERRFASVEQLRAQIASDASAAGSNTLPYGDASQTQAE